MVVAESMIEQGEAVVVVVVAVVAAVSGGMVVDMARSVDMLARIDDMPKITAC